MRGEGRKKKKEIEKPGTEAYEKRYINPMIDNIFFIFCLIYESIIPGQRNSGRHLSPKACFHWSQAFIALRPILVNDLSICIYIMSK